MNHNEFLDERAQRIMLMVDFSTKKIVKKELKKLTKDLIKQMRGF